MMKKLGSMLLITVILLVAVTLMTPSAGAVKLDDTNAYWVTGVHTDGINNDANDQAEMLKQLGLFRGTDKGFELERNMTRAEAAAMLVRLLGAEDKVLAGTWSHPFNDVPQWADKCVGWLYQSGLTKGVSRTKYGAEQNTTLEQYAVFLSRAVCGNDDWQANGIATADEVKLWDEENGFFTRAAAVGLSTRALTLTYTRNGNWTYSMAQFLVNKGLFTPEQFLNAAWGVLPPEYRYLDDEGYIYNTIAGVTVGKTDVGGLRNMTGTDSSLPYFYAYATQGRNVVLYQVDCKTMGCTMISSKALPGNGHEWMYSYVSTVGGKDYLFEYSYAANTINLVQRDGNELKTVLPDIKLSGDSVFPSSDDNYFAADDAMLIACREQYYLVDKDGISTHAYVAGTQTLGFDGKNVVTQLVTKEDTTISCLRAADGTTVESYTVKQDMQGDYDRRTVAAAKGNNPHVLRGESKGERIYYGEAGMYVLDSGSGRLKQITARPTLDLTAFRNDDRYIILTHDIGKRIHGGDQIVMIDYNGTEHVFLSNKPAHGILIEGFLNEALGGAVAFYSATDVGMQHFNIYNYVLLPAYNASTGNYERPTIIVTGYTAGRPEMEAEGYEQAYIQKEQARLDSLGYGYKS